MDFFTAVQKLRHGRACMVQTSAQYEFLHRAALESVVCKETTIVSSNIAGRIEILNNTTQFLLDPDYNDGIFVTTPLDYD
jgi:hypothetical protein